MKVQFEAEYETVVAVLALLDKAKSDSSACYPARDVGEQVDKTGMSQSRGVTPDLNNLVKVAREVVDAHFFGYVFHPGDKSEIMRDLRDAVAKFPE